MGVSTNNTSRTRRKVHDAMVRRVIVSAGIPQSWLGALYEAGMEVVPFGVAATNAANHAAELADAITNADGALTLLTDRVDRTVLERGAPRLVVVANVAVGVDNLDLVAARDLGITICNTPGVLDETTADLAWTLVLMASRCAGVAERSLRAGEWTGWQVDGYLGRDVHGATLGVVGWGGIGRAVARRAEGFGMRVLHHARTPSSEPGYVADLDDLLGEVDVLTLHVPLAPATRHLIDRRRLALLHPGAVLVNTARGAVVDEDALADALESGALFAAGLDVFEGEPAVSPRLLAAPRTVLLPHVGSATVQTRQAMTALACSEIVSMLSGRAPRHAV
jgi:glyoxylate reductase